jgi:hypothetical protein
MWGGGGLKLVWILQYPAGFMWLSIRSFLPHSGNIFIYCYPEKKADFCPNKKSPKRVIQQENLALWLDLRFSNAYKFMEAKFNKGAMTMGLNM